MGKTGKNASVKKVIYEHKAFILTANCNTTILPYCKS